MKPIVLTAEQRKEIERRRKVTLDRRVYQRLTAVLAIASGKTREEVAELLGQGRHDPLRIDPNHEPQLTSRPGPWRDRIDRRRGRAALEREHLKRAPAKHLLRAGEVGLAPGWIDRGRAGP